MSLIPVDCMSLFNNAPIHVSQSNIRSLIIGTTIYLDSVFRNAERTAYYLPDDEQLTSEQPNSVQQKSDRLAAKFKHL